MEGFKKCSKCGTIKPLLRFCRQRKKHNRLQYYFTECRDCNRKRVEQYKINNPEKAREVGRRAGKKYGNKPENKTKTYWRRLLNSYGITQTKYNELFKIQNGKCKICNTPQEKCPHRRLCVDPNHDTGQIRGLLCLNCNFAVGYLKNSAELCLSAANYCKDYP